MRKIISILIVLIFIFGGIALRINWKIRSEKELEAQRKLIQMAAEKLEQERAAQESKLAQLAEDAKQDEEKKVIEEYKSVVLSILKDPGSAHFQNIKISKGTYNSDKTKTAYQICGQVNSKNGFGGYVGFKGFVVANNIESKPTVYMQDDTLSGFIWQDIAKRIGCI